MSGFELVSGTPSTELAPGWALRAPGLVGRGAFTLTPSGARRALDTPSLGLLDEVLESLEVSERATVELTIDTAPSAAEAQRRGEVGAAEVVEFDVPPPPDDYGQFVVAAKVDGTVTWHPVHEPVQPSGRRGAGTLCRYRIPLRASGNRPAPNERRGLFPALGRQVLKVLIFPITDFVLGKVEQGIAHAWESKRRPYRVRTFELSNYQQEDVGALEADDWERLAKGPALLFVHGTFSTAHHAFGATQRRTMEELSDRYHGRLFAFDHPTLSEDPWDNASWLAEEMPRGLPPLDLDIVCHSRGGLVSRALASGLDALVGRLRVGRIVFVAAPNDGTLLAHPDHMVKMLDRYTNAIQFLPSGPFKGVLEAIVTAVKTLAHAGLQHLPGLAAVAPDSVVLELLRKVKLKGDTRCYAIAADWEPKADSPLFTLVKQKVANRVIDQVFNDEKNDLVVPTLGVAGAHGSGFPLPASQVFEFSSDAGAMHTNLFSLDETAIHLCNWLR